jgi:hypothetical protein
MPSLQAWRSREIGGREAFTHRLSAEHRLALRQLVEQTRERPCTSITRAQFSTPAIDDLMRGVAAQLHDGYGAVILSGLPIDDLSLDDFARLHWGLGTHLGEGVIQNPQGEKIVVVQREDGSANGVQADFELKPHSEFHERLSLACYSLPESGGVSGLVSGLAIHDLIAASRPDLLPALYRGYWHASPVLQRLSTSPVPVFSEVGGRWSVFYSGLFQRRAAEARQEALPADYQEALAVFNAAAEDPEIGAYFLLQPGEQLFWNNYINLHSRSAFVDSESQVRRLLRLWIRAPNGRPVVQALAERADAADRDYAGDLCPPLEV